MDRREGQGVSPPRRRRLRPVPGLEAVMLAVAFAVCATFLFGGFGEAGSFHMASAFH